jgi:hypothetical protein
MVQTSRGPNDHEVHPPAVGAAFVASAACSSTEERGGSASEHTSRKMRILPVVRPGSGISSAQTWFDILGERRGVPADDPEMFRKVLELQWPYIEPDKLYTWGNEVVPKEVVESNNWVRLLTVYLEGLQKAYTSGSGIQLPPVTEETVRKTGTEEDVETKRIAYNVSPNLTYGSTGEVIGDFELPPGIPLADRRMLYAVEKNGGMMWDRSEDGTYKTLLGTVIPEGTSLFKQYSLWCEERQIRDVLFSLPKSHFGPLVSTSTADASVPRRRSMYPEPTRTRIASSSLEEVLGKLREWFRGIDCVVREMEYRFEVEVYHKYTPTEVAVSVYLEEDQVEVEWKKVRGETVVSCDFYRLLARHLVGSFGDKANDLSGFASKPRSYEEEQALGPYLLSSESLKEDLVAVVGMLGSEWTSSNLEGCRAVANLAEQRENAILLGGSILDFLQKHLVSKSRDLALSAVSAIANIATGWRLEEKSVSEMEPLLPLLEDCASRFKCPKVGYEVARARAAIVGVRVVYV